MPIVLFAPRPARSIRTRTMPSIALASVAGVRPTAVLPARGIRNARRLAAKISTRSSLCRGAVYFPSRHHHARRVASRPLAASGGADGGNVDDDVDALSSRLESLKAKSRSMLEEASRLEAGIDASENDEVISESTRIKRSPSKSASGLPVGKMGVADAVAGIPSSSRQPSGEQSQPPQPPTTNALLAGVVAVGGLAAAGAASAAGVAAGSEPVLAIVGAAAGFALLKTGQLIGSNLKEKAVPALGKQEAKAREKAAGGYVAPKQAAAATVIDEKKAAAKAASDSAELAKSKSATASNDADAILAASSFVGASDLDKARLRRALRTIAATQKATSVSTSAASTSVPAGYVNNEQERKIYEMKQRSKELGTLNEFLDKYGPPDEVYGRAKAEKAVEMQAAELMPPGNVTWKPRETWAKVILWDCVCYPLQVPFMFLAWALGFSWGANPPPPEESA